MDREEKMVDVSVSAEKDSLSCALFTEGDAVRLHFIVRFDSKSQEELKWSDDLISLACFKEYSKLSHPTVFEDENAFLVWFDAVNKESRFPWIRLPIYCKNPGKGPYLYIEGECSRDALVGYAYADVCALCAKIFQIDYASLTKKQREIYRRKCKQYIISRFSNVRDGLSGRKFQHHIVVRVSDQQKAVTLTRLSSNSSGPLNYCINVALQDLDRAIARLQELGVISEDNARKIIPAIASEINKFLNSSANWSALLT